MIDIDSHTLSYVRWNSYEAGRRNFEYAVIAFDLTTDPKLEPSKLIQELTVSRQFEKVANIDKVVAVRQSGQREFEGT